MKEKSGQVIKSFKEVFGRPGYGALALMVAVFVVLIAIWLPNLTWIRDVFFSPLFSFGVKIKLILTSFRVLDTNFTGSARAVTLSIAVLFGINVSLLVYYMKRRVRTLKSAGTSVAGIMVGMLGIGCAACGSILISSLFGLGATASIIGLFPLQGLEFGLFGVVIIVGSIVYLALRIQEPGVCKVKKRPWFVFWRR